MLKKTFTYFTLPLLLLFGTSWENSEAQFPGKSPDGPTGTLERMIVGSGNVVMDLDLDRLNGVSSPAREAKRDSVRFEVGANSFFTVLVFNNVLRGPEPGSMGLIGGNSAVLGPVNASQLVIEKADSSEPFDLVVRDGKTGSIIFNIEGNLYEYDAGARLLSIKHGRLLISEELANRLGRPADAGSIVGEISIAATLYPIEITTVLNGAAQSAVLPARGGGDPNVPNFVPGPDVIVGDLPSMQQFGSSGTRVGLAVGTTSCNNGNVELNWFALTNTDHPVIPQNLYRMSGGTTNTERFEQVGQSWLKHAFTALQQNACGFGCTSSGTGTRLGVGCSDPYSASLNADQGGSSTADGLGSRAWVNPFTGAYPATSANHQGHSHNGTTHRILVEASDLNTTLNPGATYYAEAQYVTPHEYAWCQAHPGECNMYNNASYRRFNVSGTTSFTFSTVSGQPTVRTTSAIQAWTGATINTIEPVPATDGRGFIGYKVTGPVAGVWHYEYALYNQNLDRGIQSFSVPLGSGITVSNIGFHAPPNHPGIANDGTQASAGYSITPWTPNQTADALGWSSETFAQNQNANAIRWGTLYNFRFDSNRPPQAVNATIGFFKTGAPITVGIQGPSPDGGATPTPTPPPATPTPTPTPATPTPTPATPTPTPATPTPTPATPTPPPATPTPTPATPTPPPATPTPTPATPTPPPATPTPTPATPTPPPATPTPTPATPTPPPATPTPPAATPTPTPIPTSQAINLSTRMFIQTGDNVGVGGFIITGSVSKHVLIRAIGPSLTGVGVPNALADPVLELHGPESFVTAINDNWQDDPIQKALIEATGIPPTHNLEAAIEARLAPGAYTAVARGNNNGTGVGLIEIYDLNPGAVSKLGNISTRAFVSTGDNIVIAGFMLGGNSSPDPVIVRGIGPSLTALGVPNALTNPTLELRDGNGAMVMGNNDWQDNAAQAAELTAAGLAPSSPLESGIAAALPPGLYTALLAGQNNGTGVGLVEVYDHGR
ncbi:MAG TPA: hypothetical protein VGW39_17445 [Chthoniobacterales bacterium]|nr:hypothetical protein [Chthoniobacterales bacterium]